MATEFALELAVHDGVLVASIAGDTDRADTDGLGERLLDARASAGMVCDLSALSYIDSAGVHRLHRLSRALDTDGQRMALILPTEPTPLRVLELVGITEAVPHFATVDDAVTHLMSG